MIRPFRRALRLLLVLAVLCCFLGATKPSKSKRSSTKASAKKSAAAKTASDKTAEGKRSADKAAAEKAPSPAPSARPSPDWQIVKVGTRDYLTVDNIARFYGFPGDVTPIQKRIRLDNGKSQLEVLLDSREIGINGVRNWLCFPVTEKDGHYLVSRVDLAKTIEPQLRPQMIPNLGKLQTVVLDAGHGGWDKGASSPYGLEKDYALDVAKQLKPLLEAKGLKVIMTRERDVFVPLEVRAQIANSTRDSIFVSIHFNATDMNPAATGFEIYSLTPRGAPSTQDDALALYFLNMQAGSPVDAPSLALSTSIYHSVLGHIPEFDRGIKRARFAVLRLTRIPAVLVEGGFLTERGESKLIARPDWRGNLAEAISVGVDNYKMLLDKKQRPMLVADYRRQLGGELMAADLTQPPRDLMAANLQAPGSTTPAAVIGGMSDLQSAPSEDSIMNTIPVTNDAPKDASPPPPRPVPPADAPTTLPGDPAQAAATPAADQAPPQNAQPASAASPPPAPQMLPQDAAVSSPSPAPLQTPPPAAANPTARAPASPTPGARLHFEP